MLDHKQIIEAIKNNEINISYSFIKNGGSIIDNYELLNISVTDSVQFSFFNSNLYSDRLKLTLGPIIKSHQRKRFKNKLKFKTYDDCVDIRKSNNKYIIKPKESITILTNEHIKLSGNYAALIFPRVSLSEIGLSLSPAYIDPYYDGISRLLITNVSNNQIELKFLDVIAQCYFFKLSSEADSRFKDSFSQKSVFYGHNWNRLLNEDVEPFPTRKKHVLRNKFFNDILVEFEKIWSFLKENSFISSIVVFFITLLIGYGQFKDKYEKMSENITTVEKYKKITDSTKFIISKHDNMLSNLKMHKSELQIDKVSNLGEKIITIQIPKENIITIFLNFNNDENIHMSYSLRSGDTPNESKIFFSAKNVNETGVNKTIDFEYSILTVYNEK